MGASFVLPKTVSTYQGSDVKRSRCLLYCQHGGNAGRSRTVIDPGLGI
jgi:hypothetical protein